MLIISVQRQREGGREDCDMVIWWMCDMVDVQCVIW